MTIDVDHPVPPSGAGAVERSRIGDVAGKAARLQEVGRQAGVDRLVVRDPATLAWLLEARVHVAQTLDTACLDVVVDVASGQLTVVTNAIEAPRLQQTELEGLPVEWVVVPWWEPREPHLAQPGLSMGADRVTALAGAIDLGAAMAAVRRVLTERQQALYAAVARDAAAAATAVAEGLTPESTEQSAAGALAAELLERGLDPVVLLVGADERIGPHRHPLPTATPLGARAMLVACARRHGLIANVTRLLAFGRPAGEAAYRQLLEVERAFLDATTAGARLGDVVTAGVGAYAAHGFDADEWHRHHQGGLTGVTTREFPAAPGSDVVLEVGHAVAWNPSGRGWKVEDTGVVTADGLRLLVDDGVWPTVEVGGRRRPDVLVR